ncbi:MAG TPA: 4-carboxymuconolactone decarboxylase [Candidatus Acidoferrum sp.]|nr:4-carboxymuconolactone decarboxylase [Candidatus Acidoferrum sp.]
MDERERHQQGMKIRREVLGNDHVDGAAQSATDFTAPFQDLITRYAWGEVWSRPGLSRHTRSLLTLAMTVALNREEEFRLHLRAARNNGVTPDEIRETLLHAAIYCGVPAANHAFKIAAEVLAAERPQPPISRQFRRYISRRWTCPRKTCNLLFVLASLLASSIALPCVQIPPGFCTPWHPRCLACPRRLVLAFRPISASKAPSASALTLASFAPAIPFLPSAISPKCIKSAL